MMIVVIWIALSVAIGAYAHGKGRSGVSVFLLCLFLSPLVGFVFALAMHPYEQKVATQTGKKECPECAEFVQSNAKLCHFCQHRFAEGEAEAAEVATKSFCTKCGGNTFSSVVKAKASRWWMDAHVRSLHCGKCGELWQDGESWENVNGPIFIAGVLVAGVLLISGVVLIANHSTPTVTNPEALVKYTADGRVNPAYKASHPDCCKVLATADQAYTHASFDYLKSANTAGTGLATIWAGASNGTSSLEDCHIAVRKALSAENTRYAAYLASRGTVSPAFKNVDKQIGQIHKKSLTALSSVSNYWTTGDLNSISRGIEQYKAAILDMNPTITEATAAMESAAR